MPVEVGSGLNLCDAHLWAAHDWVEREVGMTDLLPSPCVACGSRVDVVYYLRFGDRIKIGTSSNPHARLAQLRFDELLALEHGGRSTEQRRHAQFAEYRFPGSEWFHSNESLVAHIKGIAEGVDDPWNLHRRWRSEQLALRQFS